jgi:two-component system nitrate/nitrite response regulator NarL
MNILIADHQPLIRRGIMEILSNTKDSYGIYEAGTLAEALKIAQAQNVDMTFIDLHLGSDDGLELVDKVRHSMQDSMKFILMATTISIFEFRRAKELGVDGYILKDALVEDILYAFNVVKRGEKFYQSKIIEKAFTGVESEGLKLLTERELDVFSELRKGLTNDQISNNLFITEGTTKKHISSILNKLKLSNRMEVVVYANKLYGNQS